MPSPGNGELPFQVGFSEVIAQTIRDLQRQASREGRGKDFLAAFRKAVNRLQTSPRAFGEPLYRLPALRMQIRCGALGPLISGCAMIARWYLSWQSDFCPPKGHSPAKLTHG